ESLPVVKPLDNETLGRVNADGDESLVADCGEAVRSAGSYDDDVAGACDNLLTVDRHRDFAGTNDAGFGIGMPVHPGTFAGHKIANEKGNSGAVWLAFELHRGNRTFALLAFIHNVQHFDPFAWGGLIYRNCHLSGGS